MTQDIADKFFKVYSRINSMRIPMKEKKILLKRELTEDELAKCCEMQGAITKRFMNVGFFEFLKSF